MRLLKASATIAALLLVGRAAAQQSPNYRATEYVLNAGGVPANGLSLASTNFTITVGSLGEAAVGIGLGLSSFAASSTTGSFSVDSGFVTFGPPPGEITGNRFGDKTTLSWDPERSIGTYDLYRGDLADLPTLGYGTCLEHGLLDETATDAAIPLTGHGYYYLITARNSLDEKGTKGTSSNGSERGNAAPCP